MSPLHIPILAGISWALLAFASTALAHPLVDGGRDLYEQGHFEGALDAFTRAEAASDLTLQDLERLFESRALVHHAMGNAPALEADMRRLAAIAPEHELDEGVPPDIRAVFVRVRGQLPGRLRLAVETEASATGVTIRAEVENGEGLVRNVRALGRRAEQGWLESTDAPLFVPSPGGGVVEYYAEAIGPGGAVLTSSGSRTEPLTAEPAAPTPASGGSLADEDVSSSTWIWWTVAGVLVAAAAVVTVLLITDDGLSDETQPSSFMVTF